MTATKYLPVTLPYCDVLRGRSGWQFGLHGPDPEYGQVHAGKVVVLLDDGTAFDTREIVTPPNLEAGKPGLPQWAWPLVQQAGELRPYRVQAPVPALGAAPLTVGGQVVVEERAYVHDPVGDPVDGRNPCEMKRLVMTPRGIKVFAARAALADFRFERLATDFAEDVPMPRGMDPGYSRRSYGVVELGQTEFCRLWYEDGYVLGFEPFEFCYERGLWNVHLPAAALPTFVGERPQASYPAGGPTGSSAERPSQD